MKYFYLCCTLFLFSCSNPLELSELEVASNELYKDEETPSPVNASNPFDSAGHIHQQLLTAYFLEDQLPQSSSGIATKVVDLALADSSFVALGSGYQFSALTRVEYIVLEGQACSHEVVTSTLNDSTAIASLKTFIATVFSMCDSETEFAPVYNYITAYEAGVLAHSNWLASDKEKMLISTSIARHAAYARKKKPKKNKDPDWDLLVSNVLAAVDGADVSMQEAIVRGLVAGIIENK